MCSMTFSWQLAMKAKHFLRFTYSGPQRMFASHGSQTIAGRLSHTPVVEQSDERAR